VFTPRRRGPRHATLVVTTAGGRRTRIPLSGFGRRRLIRPWLDRLRGVFRPMR